MLDATILVAPIVLLVTVPVALLEAVILLALSLFCFSVSGALATGLVKGTLGLGAVVVVVGGFGLGADGTLGEVFVAEGYKLKTIFFIKHRKFM